MAGKNMLAEQNQQQPAVTETGLAAAQKDITDSVMKRITELEGRPGFKMPQGYSPNNALKSAWLKLQTVEDREKNKALAVCTQASIANALFDMCIQGLSPAKNQCYFIVYGKELTLMRSYFGTAAVLKRLNGVEDVFAQVVYQNDVFEYEIEGGNIVITRHDQKLENIDMDKIVGAYCVIVKDGKPRTEIMTKKQIDKSWSKTKNGGGVQKDFPDQMAKRTVINRAAKMYVNTSDDADELIESINRTTENEYDNRQPENGDEITIPEAPQQKPIEVEGKVSDPEPVEQPKTETSRKPGF